MRKNLFMFLLLLTIALPAAIAQTNPVIKNADLSSDDISRIQAALKGADPSTYSISFVQNGKVTRLGSANLRGLKTVSAYHKAGTTANAANEIVTTVGDYVKTVWTSSFTSKYPDKVRTINQILEAGVSKVSVRQPVTSVKTNPASLKVTPAIKKATFTNDEITQIQKILKDADPSTYNASFGQNGKITRMGSSSMASLTTVSAYHKIGSGATAANEIVTTVGDYVKTVWTSSFANKYPDKVRMINQIMERAAMRQ